MDAFNTPEAKSSRRLTTLRDCQSRPATIARNAAMHLAYLVTAAIVLLIFVHDHGINSYERARFLDMLHGTAHKPFVCRVLAPATIRLVSSALPSSIQERINHQLIEIPFVRKTTSNMMWEPGHLTEYGVAMLLMYLALLGFAYSIRYLYDTFFWGTLRNTVPLVALAGLPVMFFCNYLYDCTTLFLFTLGLGLMAREKWLPFLIHLQPVVRQQGNHYPADFRLCPGAPEGAILDAGSRATPDLCRSQSIAVAGVRRESGDNGRIPSPRP